MEEPALLESSSLSSSSFLSFVRFSAFFAIREEVSSEDTAIFNIWKKKKIRLLLFVGTALHSHVNPCDIIWIMKVLLLSFPHIFKRVLPSHWSLGVGGERLMLHSNIFIDTRIKWLGNVESISLYFGFAFFVCLLQAKVLSKRVAEDHLHSNGLHCYPRLYRHQLHTSPLTTASCVLGTCPFCVL